MLKSNSGLGPNDYDLSNGEVAISILIDSDLYGECFNKANLPNIKSENLR